MYDNHILLFTIGNKTCEKLSDVILSGHLHKAMKYRILQIVRGGKVSRLQNLTVIRWKTFAVGPSSFKTYYQKEIISLEKFRGYQLIRENRETFPP